MFIQFNFTDVKPVASIVAMSNPTSRTLQVDEHPLAPADTACQKAKGRNALRRAAESVQHWWTGVSAALARAEQHVMENFRQPPHGG